MTKAKKVFVCGVARSGTTALCELLNLHEELLVGVERYKYIIMGKCELDDTKGLFNRDRFFDYRTADTNIKLDDTRYKGIYDRGLQKFDRVKYIGDKVPGYYKKIPFLLKAFPDSKIIYIVRDPLNVANSWQSRADGEGKSWPSENGFREAVTEWNKSIAGIQKFYSKNPDRISLFSYERLFGPHRHIVWQTMCQSLQISANITKPISEFLDQSHHILQKQRVQNEDIVNYIENNANFRQYSKVLNVAY